MASAEVTLIIHSRGSSSGLIRLLTSCEQLLNRESIGEIVVVGDALSPRLQDLVSEMRFSVPIILAGSSQNDMPEAAQYLVFEEGRGDTLIFLKEGMEASPNLLNILSFTKSDQPVLKSAFCRLPPFVTQNRWFRFLDDLDGGLFAGVERGINRENLPVILNFAGPFSIRRDVLRELGGISREAWSAGLEFHEVAFRVLDSDRWVLDMIDETASTYQYSGYRPTQRAILEFSKEILPRMEKRYPGFAEKVFSDNLDILPKRNRKRSRRGVSLCTRFLAREPFVFLARAIRLVLPGRFSAPIFRLILYARAKRGNPQGEVIIS